MSLSFLSRLPEFIRILPLLFLLSCYWGQDLAETPISRFCISWCLSTALFSLLVVCQHLLTDGKGWSMVKLSGCYKGKQRWCLVQFIKFFAVWKLGYIYRLNISILYAYWQMYIQSSMIVPDYTGHIGWLVPQSLGTVGKPDSLPALGMNEAFFVEPLIRSKFISVSFCSPSYIIYWKRKKH